MAYLKTIRKKALLARSRPLPNKQTGSEIQMPSEKEAQELLQLLDSIHEALQETIFAADRNLRLMEDCTREIHTSVNILRWSNDLSAKQHLSSEVALS